MVMAGVVIGVIAGLPLPLIEERQLLTFVRSFWLHAWRMMRPLLPSIYTDQIACLLLWERRAAGTIVP